MIPRIVLVILLLSPLAWAVPLPYNPTYIYNHTDSLLFRGLEHIYVEEFDSAIATFDSVIQEDPESPRGYFFVAATYSNLANDYRNPAYSYIFYENVNKAIDIGEKRAKSGKATAEDLLYYGGAVGYRGIYKSFLGDWVGAFSDGLKGRSLLHQAFDKDTTFKDIYLGLGTYDYYRSAMTKSFRWLPFFPDKRKQGINEILIAAKDGKFSRFEAEYALIRVYYDYKKYDKLLDIWENNLKQINPHEPYSLYWVGQAYIAVKQYDQARECFQTILKIYLDSPFYDPGGEMECRYYLGLCLSKLGQNEEALKHLSLSALAAQALDDRKDIEEALHLVQDIYNDVRKKVPAQH